MVLGDGTTWDVTVPTDATVAVQIDDYNRDVRAGVQARMNLEHVWPAAQSATNEAGLHRYITLSMQTAAPSLVVGTNTQVGAIFVTSGNGLVFRNSASADVGLVSAFGAGPVPTGAMLPFAGTTAPTGFYLCNGTAVSRTTDAALYAVIGTIWGTGDGSTTFNVPDYQGFNFVMKSTGGIFATVASSTGELTHLLTGTESGVPVHTHPHYAQDGYSAGHAIPAARNSYTSNTEFTTGNNAAADASTAHNNVQPSKVGQLIIKR